jgi:phosphoribosylanthranilate isomerase
MFRPLRIKVCGLRDPGNIEQVCRLGPDYVGYIFYPPSKRYVGVHPDSHIFAIPREPVRKVGVFVNEEILSVQRTFERCRLDLVQLHGEESPEYCMRLNRSGIPVIKTFHPGKALGQEKYSDYVEQANYFLFDNRETGKQKNGYGGTGNQEEGYGGTGSRFDWEVLKRYSIPFPFILSGGIGPEDVPAIRKLGHEWLYGVDVNSRFETSPGMKEIHGLEDFIDAIRKTE